MNQIVHVAEPTNIPAMTAVINAIFAMETFLGAREPDQGGPSQDDGEGYFLTRLRLLRSSNR